jgi:hypothetical protein
LVTFEPGVQVDSSVACAAVDTNRILPGSRLLTVQGHGHTAFAQPSPCADRVVQAYLIEGVLPARGAICAMDKGPFE